MAKKQLTFSEFREIIKEEAIKLKKKMVLEAEKKALEKELNTLMNEEFETVDGEIEEGISSAIKGAFGYGEDAYRKKFQNYASKYGINYTPEELESLVQQMVQDKGEGYPGRNKQGKLIYLPSRGASPHGAGAPGAGISSNV